MVILIIIDGLDKAGKTTLQEGLIETYSNMYSYRLERADIVNNNFGDCDSDYWKFFVLVQKIEMTTVTKVHETMGLHNMIIDRFHATEWAYTESDGEKNLDYIWKLDEKLAMSKYPALFIFLDVSVNWALNHQDEDEKRQMNEGRLRGFRQRYLEFYARSKMTKTKIMVEHYDVWGVLNETKKFLMKTSYFLHV